MLFQQSLDIGNYWEAFIANRLLASRCPIWYPRQTKKECRGNYRENQVDLLTFVNGVWQALEVKSRSERFDSIQDFPYPLVSIGSVEHWDAINFPVLAVIVVSQITRNWGWVDYHETRQFWQPRQLRDLAYCVPRSLFRPPSQLVHRLSIQVQFLPELFEHQSRAGQG